MSTVVKSPSRSTKAASVSGTRKPKGTAKTVPVKSTSPPAVDTEVQIPIDAVMITHNDRTEFSNYAINTLDIEAWEALNGPALKAYHDKRAKKKV